MAKPPATIATPTRKLSGTRVIEEAIRIILGLRIARDKGFLGIAAARNGIRCRRRGFSRARAAAANYFTVGDVGPCSSDHDRTQGTVPPRGSGNQSEVEIGLEPYRTGAINAEFQMVEPANDAAGVLAQPAWPTDIGDTLAWPGKQGGMSAVAYRGQQSGGAQQLLPAIRAERTELDAETRTDDASGQVQPQRDVPAMPSRHVQDLPERACLAGPIKPLQ
jgi:hypothetical protein